MAAPLRDAAGLNPAQRAVQVAHDGDLSSINATILNRLRVLRWCSRTTTTNGGTVGSLGLRTLRLSASTC